MNSKWEPTWDRVTKNGHDSTKSNGKPTTKIGRCNCDESLGNGCITWWLWRIGDHDVLCDGYVDESLTQCDEEKQKEVGENEDGLGISPSSERLPGLGKKIKTISECLLWNVEDGCS